VPFDKKALATITLGTVGQPAFPEVYVEATDFEWIME